MADEIIDTVAEILAEMFRELIDLAKNSVRIALLIARLLFGLCTLLAAFVSLGFANIIAQLPVNSQDMSFCIFPLIWIAGGLAVAGLQQFAAMAETPSKCFCPTCGLQSRVLPNLTRPDKRPCYEATRGLTSAAAE